MATFVSNDAFVSIGGVDLSDHCVSAECTYEAEVQDDTVMSDDTRSHAGGLKNWTMTVQFLQDYAASKVDATIQPLVGSTTTCTVRPVATGGVSATNPNYTGLGLISSYNPLSGTVGDMSKASVTIMSAGDLSRATS